MPGRKLHLRKLTVRRLDPDAAGQVRGRGEDFEPKTVLMLACDSDLEADCSAVADAGCNPNPSVVMAGVAAPVCQSCEYTNCLSCPPADPTIAHTYCPCHA